MDGSRSATGQDVIASHPPRMLVANAEQRRHLDRAVADVRLGNPQSARVVAVLDGLVPIRSQFASGSHYLLATASHLLDEEVVDEDYELAEKLSIAVGDAVMVLRRVSGSEGHATGDGDALVRGFYDGAESDAPTRALLLEALGVMREAVSELRDEDVLIVLAK